MKQTDYKFWYIKREDNVHISECAVRFFEGEVNTKPEKGIDETTSPVTRYRRIKRLLPKDLKHLKSKEIKVDENGNPTMIYTSKDFGLISDDDELRVFLNGELSKDNRRIPNETQKETDLVKLKKQELR